MYTEKGLGFEPLQHHAGEPQFQHVHHRSVDKLRICVNKRFVVSLLVLSLGGQSYVTSESFFKEVGNIL